MPERKRDDVLRTLAWRPCECNAQQAAETDTRLKSDPCHPRAMLDLLDDVQNEVRGVPPRRPS